MSQGPTERGKTPCNGDTGKGAELSADPQRGQNRGTCVAEECSHPARLQHPTGENGDLTTSVTSRPSGSPGVLETTAPRRQETGQRPRHRTSTRPADRAAAESQCGLREARPGPASAASRQDGALPTGWPHGNPVEPKGRRWSEGPRGTLGCTNLSRWAPNSPRSGSRQPGTLPLLAPQHLGSPLLTSPIQSTAPHRNFKKASASVPQLQDGDEGRVAGPTWTPAVTGLRSLQVSKPRRSQHKGAAGGTPLRAPRALPSARHCQVGPVWASGGC